MKLLTLLCASCGFQKDSKSCGMNRHFGPESTLIDNNLPLSILVVALCQLFIATLRLS